MTPLERISEVISKAKINDETKKALILFIAGAKRELTESDFEIAMKGIEKEIAKKEKELN